MSVICRWDQPYRGEPDRQDVRGRRPVANPFWRPSCSNEFGHRALPDPLATATGEEDACACDTGTARSDAVRRVHRGTRPGPGTVDRLRLASRSHLDADVDDRH